MRHQRTLIAWSLAALFTLIAMLVPIASIAADKDAHEGLFGRIINRISGGKIQVEGLSGLLTGALKATQLRVADNNGVWLTVYNVELDWSPFRLLHGEFLIDRLNARRAVVARKPVASGGSFSMPFHQVTLSRMQIDRIEVGESLVGRPVVLKAEGNGKLTGSDKVQAHLSAVSLGPTGAPAPGQGDRYTADVSVDPTHVRGQINVAEASKGLLSGLIGLPDLPSIDATAQAEGPKDAVSTRALVTAGPLNASANGTVDLNADSADLTLTLSSPAMEPAPGVSWSSLTANVTAKGPLKAPMVNAKFAASSLVAAGAAIGALSAKVSGDVTGKTEISATADDLRVPGPSPDLLAGSPLALTATAQLGQPNWPTQFALSHSLFSAKGTASEIAAHVRLTVPHLAPLARAGGLDLAGDTTLDLNAEWGSPVASVAVQGRFGVTGGRAPLPSLVVEAGTIDLAALIRGEDLTLNRFRMHGANADVSVSGSYTKGRVNADWTAALTDLAAIRQGASGHIAAQGNLAGTLDSLSTTADLTGEAAAWGGRMQDVSAHLVAQGIPSAPSGRLTASGSVLNAPLALDVAAADQARVIHVAINKASWKSLQAGGALTFPSGAMLPVGNATLTMGDLSDLSPIVGRDLAGQLSAGIVTSSDTVRMNAQMAGASVAGIGAIRHATLDATVANPTANPVLDGALALDGVDASGVSGSARLTAKGPRNALSTALEAKAADLGGGPASVSASGTLDAVADRLALDRLRLAWQGETAHLLAPTHIVFANGVSVDRLRLGVRQGEIMVAGGETAGHLDLNATVSNLPAALASAVSPDYAAEGTIAAQAHLSGTISRPRGSVRLTANRVRANKGAGRAMPPANLVLTADLEGTAAHVSGKLTVGSSAVSATGTAPLSLTGPLNVHVGGRIDLALANPMLAAKGRNVKGTASVDVTVAGTPEQPRIDGTMRLARGEVEDASVGARITRIAGLISARNKTVQIVRLTGEAGPGTLSVSGRIALAGTPTVDLSLRARNARLLATDIVTARTDATLTLRGPITGTPVASGRIFVREANIQVPESLPPSIPTLPVRFANAPPVKPTPPPQPALDLALNIVLNAPARVYVRGRGLDAELGGHVVFRGTTETPIANGALHLRRGAYSLVGQTLRMTEGTIDFAGGALTNPRLDLVATETSGSITATLRLTGDVQNLKIVLSSVPVMPQDEILSQLLFNTARSKLSPFQVAEIASALAQITGVDTGIGDPLARLRSKLGLDELSIGTSASGGATLQAGRYVAPGVHVGAREGVTGDETQAVVQIDLAKGLKLETTVGSGGTAAASATPSTESSGTSVGLTYQFEY